MKIAHLSDSHLQKINVYFISATERLKIILNFIQNNHYDAILYTGDLTAEGDRDSILIATTLFDDLGIPCWFIGGNHDNRRIMEVIFNKSKNCKLLSSLVQLGDWTITTLDSCIENHHDGYLNFDQLNMLHHQLENCFKPVILMIHHPFHKTGIAAIDHYGLKGASNFYAELPSKIKLVLCGHVHGDYQWIEKNISCHAAPSTAYQFESENYLSYRPKAIIKTGYLVDTTRFGFKTYKLERDFFHSQTEWFYDETD